MVGICSVCCSLVLDGEMIYLNGSGVLVDGIIESTRFERTISFFFEPLDILDTFP